MTTIDLINALRQSEPVRLGSAARERIRARVLAEFSRVTTGGGQRYMSVEHPYHRGWAFALAPAAVVVLMVAAIGTTAAADAAKPGDWLYVWDRGIEKVRLSLTVGASARAKVQADLAEERAVELDVLVQSSSNDTSSAEVETDQALNQAIETVTEVKVKQEAKGNDRATEALDRVEERLKQLQDKQRERSKRKTDGTSSSSTEVNVKVQGQSSKITIKINGQESSFTLNSNSTADILVAVMARTGLSEAAARAILHLETDTSQDQDDDQPTTKNVNLSISNRHDSRDDDDRSQSAVIIVEVDSDDQTAKIKTNVNGQEQEWELATTSQTEIAASINARTGLSTAEIRQLWDFEIE